MALYVRTVEEEEQKDLEQIIQEPESDIPIQRILIIHLSAQGRRVQDISREVDLHPINVRKWIHRFNQNGLDGLRSGKSPGRPPVFTNNQRQKIVKIANTDPSAFNLTFTHWSLQKLQKYLIDSEVVKQISVETIRQILRVHGIHPHAMPNWRRNIHYPNRS